MPEIDVFCLVPPSPPAAEPPPPLEIVGLCIPLRSRCRYEIMLSTRPEKSVGTDEIWDLATEGLKGALKRKGWDYTVGWFMFFSVVLSLWGTLVKFDVLDERRSQRVGLRGG